jgi:hypothetical protein
MLSLSEEAGSLTVTFDPDADLTLNLASRKNLALARIKACLKRHNPKDLYADDRIVRAYYGRISKRARDTLVNEAYSISKEIKQMPLTPRMVCSILNISSQERIRLMREGKINRSGQSQFCSDTHQGYFSLFSSESVRDYLRSIRG